MSQRSHVDVSRQEKSHLLTQDVYVDVRCLQDHRFRDRGIGQHVTALLNGADRFAPPGRRLRFIAGIDRGLPPLESRHRALFACEQRITAPVPPGTLFIQMSPMTHPADLLQTNLSMPSVRTVAVVYDFIPLQYPRLYLANEAQRAEYMALLSGLGDYDRFISISQATSASLQDLLELEPERCHVSGVAVRTAVIGAAALPATIPYCLAVVGDDPRKNVEALVLAHGRSIALQAAGVHIKIVGHYGEVARTRLRHLHESGGLTVSPLEFTNGLSDRELADLYGGAMVTVCPSRAEGFSIPVVEANANGCPVIVSSCPAQSELMPLAEFQFAPDDHERLRHLLEAFLDPVFAERSTVKQAGFWRHYKAAAVQERFWRAALIDVTPVQPAVISAPYVTRGLLPRLAVASPVPPDRSGVADYTLATMRSLAERAHLDLYTETRGRLGGDVFATVQPLSSKPFTCGRYDAVVSVIGNSHFHLAIFNFLLQYGGACVAHDARMVHFYAALLGRERTLDVASRELGRSVIWSDVEGWLANQRTLPTSFLSEVLEASEPVFIHSVVTKQFIQTHHNAESTYLPFAIYREMWPEYQGREGRSRARDFLGFQPNEKVLISLGDLVDDKAITECIWTTAMLLSWGIRVRLVLAGNGDPIFIAYMQSLIEAIGIDKHVRISRGYVNERTYQALLMAADAAIQFRTYGLGGLSGALLDEIAVGLPTVVNASLAAAMQAPSYIATVPDGISPLLAAEQLAAIFEQPNRSQHEDDRRAFVLKHSTGVYADRMLEGLGIA